jgi:hypothetical protein
MSLNLTNQRVCQTKRSTTGNLLIGGVPSFVVLEPPPSPNPPPPDGDGNGYICIEAGIFPLTIRWSTKFNRAVPHVEEVPNRSAIELHIGNFPLNSDGCGLIGKDFGGQSDYVSFSSLSFASLMTILYAGAILTNPASSEQNQIWQVGTITYIDPVSN